MEKAPGAHCDDCPLREFKYARGTGPKKAEIVIVGEAPGADEVVSGTPFSGPSGQLLNNILKYHDIKREQVYLTNTVICRPPDNRTPSAVEIAACHDRLVQEIKAHEPECILALGATAAQAIVASRSSISSLRTEPDLISPYLGDKVRILPTYHPAAALRSPDYFPSILSDVKKIHQVKVEWEYTKKKVVDNEREALATLRAQAEQAISLGGTIVDDVELDIESMQRTDLKRPVWLCNGISSRPGAAVVYTPGALTPRYWAELDKLFQDKRLKWTGQNFKFDIQPLWGSNVPHAHVDDDTMLMHYATDERKGTHDLEQLAVEILGAPRYKTDARSYLPRKGASLAYLPPNILYEYNAGDCDVTHRLVRPLRSDMESDGVTRSYNDLLIPGSNALAPAEYVGIKVDEARLEELAEELWGELVPFRERLQNWVNNPNSPIQLKKMYQEHFGYDLPDTRKERLRELAQAHKGQELGMFTELLLDYRNRLKLRSTYVVGLSKRIVRGRVHPTFLLHGTETGRLSARQPNIQNIPSGSKIRDLYIAGPDNVLLSADYSQIEFRLAAILSGDPWLLEQFKAGRAFHKEVARQFYGEEYSELQYLRAKAVNFGILYLRGAKSLAEEHKFPLSEGVRMIKEFYRQMPRVKEWQDDIHKQLRQLGYLESYFGRKRRFWLVTRENWHAVSKEAVNFPLQSTASDLTLRSLIRLEPLLRGKAAPVITVHDSLVFEVRRQYLEEVAATVVSVMEDTGLQDICPTPVELKVGRKWGSHRGSCPDPVCEHLKDYELPSAYAA